MELILLIGKIILIALLVVLGLILLALGLILFVPIRYEVSGSIGDAWELRIQGKVTYLLSIIKVLFAYEESHFDLKVFLFGVEKNLQEESDDSSEEVSETVDTTEEVAQEKDAEITFHEKEEQLLSEGQTSHTGKLETENTDISQVQDRADKSSEEEETIDRLKESDASKKKRQKKVKEKSKFDFAFIKQQITDEHNKSVVRKVWSEICYLLKHFKFRKIVTDFVFSTGDPATTGQALGVLCLIPTLYQYEFHILPDFEAENGYLKGTFLVAGKIRLIHILITVLRLILDKEVRLVFKRVQTLIG